MDTIEKKTPMGAYAYQAGPFSVYQVAHKIRVDMGSGTEIEFLRQHHSEWGGYPPEIIDVIIETIQSERATYGDGYPKQMR